MPTVVTMVVTPRLAELFERRIDGVRRGLDEFTQDLAVEVHWRVARRTPVLTGRLRGNTRLGINELDLYYDENHFDPSGADVHAEAVEIARNLRIGDRFFISNAAPYALAMERGGSKKAPEGYMAVTATEVPFLAELLLRDMVGRLHGRGENIGRMP